MSLANAIRAAVAAAAPPSAGAFRAQPAADPASSQRFAALLDVARARLRQAHAERARAEGELRAAEARVARALDVVDGAERADRWAAEAEAIARAAAAEWTAAGCPEASRPDQGLLDRSARAADAAADAKTLADGARAALPGLREAAQDARTALDRAQGGVRSAAVDILAARAEPRLAELARLRDEYEAALRPVEHLRHLLRAWGPQHPLAGFAAPDVVAAIDARLREASVQPAVEPDLAGGASDLRAQALRLLEDPEAKL